LDDSYINKEEINIRWSAAERWGIRSFQLWIDSQPISANMNKGEYSTTLSSGEHTIKVQTIDMAGNSDMEEITFNIDVEIPELTLLEPMEKVITDQYIEFKWKGEDDHGIDHYNITLDNRTSYDLVGITDKSFLVKEGRHSLVLKCFDLAGNMAEITKEFIVDLNPPDISFQNIPARSVKFFSGLISWNVTETVGLQSLHLFIDGLEYNLALDSTFFNLELDEGFHEVRISATDIGGFKDEDRFSFSIDKIEPDLLKESEPLVIRGTTAVIKWIIGEDTENLTWSLFLDDEEIMVQLQLSKEEFKFTELEPGDHTARLVVTDQAGNEKELTWEFNIKESGSGGSSNRSNAILVALILFVILLLTVGGAAAYIFSKGRNKEEVRKIEAPKKPQKLSLASGPVQPAVHHSHHHRTASHVIASHPIKSGEESHGYIRPEREKPMKRKKTIIDAPPSDVVKNKGKSSFSSRPVRQTKVYEKDLESVDEWSDVEEWDSEAAIEDWGGGDEIEEWDEMEEV
jgi:hypothetical protein